MQADQANPEIVVKMTKRLGYTKMYLSYAELYVTSTNHLYLLCPAENESSCKEFWCEQ